MIPASSVEIVFLIAAFGPGYVYLGVAERRSSRGQRSGLVEAVELAVIGAFASALALLSVAAIAEATGAIDIHALVANRHSYATHHPFKVLVFAVVILALAYTLAYAAARIVYRNATADIRSGTGWTELFHAAREREPNVRVRLTAELRDGRKIEGSLGGHTTQQSENREVLLLAPIRFVPADGSDAVDSTERFAFLREQDVVTITGHFLPGPVLPSGESNPVPGWQMTDASPLPPAPPHS